MDLSSGWRFNFMRPRVDDLSESFLAPEDPGGKWEHSVLLIIAGRMQGESLRYQLVSRGFDVDLLDRRLTEEDFREQSPLFSFVWGRDFRQQNADAFAKVVGAEVLIHGHEPAPEGFAVPNTRQVILDCQGEKASYAILPVGVPLTQQQVVELIKRLR